MRRRWPPGTSIPASSIACRTTKRSRERQGRRHQAHDHGRHRPDRGLGGSGAGLISLIVLEMGGSQPVCRARCEPGEKVVLMGPTGTPTEFRTSRPSCCSAAAWATPCCSPSPWRCKEQNNKVIYFAGYSRADDLFKRHEIEKACDVGGVEHGRGPPIVPAPAARPHFRGNIVEAHAGLCGWRTGRAAVPLDAVQRIIAIGSDRMMAAVKDARHGVLAAVPEARATSASGPSTRRCNA